MKIRLLIIGSFLTGLGTLLLAAYSSDLINPQHPYPFFSIVVPLTVITGVITSVIVFEELSK